MQNRTLLFFELDRSYFEFKIIVSYVYFLKRDIETIIR